MKFINTYPISEQKVNLSRHHSLTLFCPNDLHRTSIRDKINNSLIFLSIKQLCDEVNSNNINAIFKNLQSNNYCILYHDHKTNIDLFVDILDTYIKNYHINPNKLFIILYLPSEVDPARKKLDIMGYSKIPLIYKMNWLLWTKYHYKHKGKSVPSYKFSIFVRRYDDWRFQFYVNLINDGILDNTVYTFSNSHPDFNNSEISKDILKKNIHNKFAPDIITKIEKWIESLPIEFIDDSVYPVSDVIFSKLVDSHIHIVCETMLNDGFNGVSLTEKTYKPIVAGKPFIIFGQTKILQLLRNQGFKTFHPIIDESYDNIEDNDLRMKTICQELKRINELPHEKLLELIENCNDVIEHNLRLVDYYWTEGYPPNYKKLNIFG